MQLEQSLADYSGCGRLQFVRQKHNVAKGIHRAAIYFIEIVSHKGN